LDSASCLLIMYTSIGLASVDHVHKYRIGQRIAQASFFIRELQYTTLYLDSDLNRLRHDDRNRHKFSLPLTGADRQNSPLGIRNG
jgi:hypothetical protein